MRDTDAIHCFQPCLFGGFKLAQGAFQPGQTVIAGGNIVEVDQTAQHISLLVLWRTLYEFQRGTAFVETFVDLLVVEILPTQLRIGIVEHESWGS
ncbi:hypothetical protein [Rhizobium sp. CFBP 8762]|uniref:hypothetical protein n=1 Tax=Rhizobium sp. CFBP 8762 TaxID=2775279 RepID=UPI001FCFB314|nr:hypothetical protein [Rhizobium sp. CFBP 8762]